MTCHLTVPPPSFQLSFHCPCDGCGALHDVSWYEKPIPLAVLFLCSFLQMSQAKADGMQQVHSGHQRANELQETTKRKWRTKVGCHSIVACAGPLSAVDGVPPRAGWPISQTNPDSLTLALWPRYTRFKAYITHPCYLHEKYLLWRTF